LVKLKRVKWSIYITHFKQDGLLEGLSGLFGVEGQCRMEKQMWLQRSSRPEKKAHFFRNAGQAEGGSKRNQKRNVELEKHGKNKK
jgi:hypothetical protein